MTTSTTCLLMLHMKRLESETHFRLFRRTKFLPSFLQWKKDDNSRDAVAFYRPRTA